MKKIYCFVTILFLTFSAAFPQQNLSDRYREYIRDHPQGAPLNAVDSLYFISIPELKLPEGLRSNPLPPEVDNSLLPYLRPVFQQGGASCGQAAMIGYNFTYEIDYHRGLPADTSANQYPTHFTWNFGNGGNGYFGVSYFHSLEILRMCGCMNVDEYGEMGGNSKRWITGYDKYYNGMLNRINRYYRINTGTVDGILAVKHWVFNHMGESDEGGVASYYANTTWNAQLLNDTTPEGGKYVMVEWYPSATHAMTIMGYNDSIRWDYNGDGQYTNNIDLNDDGIIDPRDWEIGGVRFINSWGLDVTDSGYCYMMYKALAETFESGGVWNQSVNVLDIKEDYSPMLAYKVTLKHDYRQKIKVMAGVSSDTSELSPAYVMDFPIFDHQGANHYMQGLDTAEYLKSIEFGLDVTPLLSHLEPGQPAKFFLLVEEEDPHNEGTGEVTTFSLMDYITGTIELPCPAAPCLLVENGMTVLSVLNVPEFDKVIITSEVLPAFEENQSYSFQLQATGGDTPYRWDFQHTYVRSEQADEFPLVDDIMLMPNAEDDTIVPVALGFDFPFYGNIFDTVYMHINGYLQFDHQQLPWPYIDEEMLLLKSNRIIAPFSHYNLGFQAESEDGGWYEGDSSYAIFRWRSSWMENPEGTYINFAVKLFPSGKIEFFSGASDFGTMPWFSGISNGDKVNYLPSASPETPPFPSERKINFSPLSFPAGMELSESGLFSGYPPDNSKIFDLPFRVTDNNNISSVKILQLSSGPLLNFTIHAGGDEIIEYGDTVLMDFSIENISGETLHNAMLELDKDDPFFWFSDSAQSVGELIPGQIMTFPEAFCFIVSGEVPDMHLLLSQATLSTDEKIWYKDLNFTVIAPMVRVSNIEIDDGGNGILEPGETADVILTLENAGHALIKGVSCEMESLDSHVQIISGPVQNYGDLGKGHSALMPFALYAEDTTPNGTRAAFALDITSASGLDYFDTIRIQVGKTPVLVIDMDPNHHSGPIIYSTLQELDVNSEYLDFIPGDIDLYQSLFICLGYHFSNHVLNWYEGDVLSNYLDKGGKIYMEGRKTWYEDQQTPLQPRFNILPSGNVLEYDTLVGLDSTFTEGMQFYNNAVHAISFYWIDPIPSAFTILKDNDNLKSCAVAYDAGIYKTIGVLFEFGTLLDGAPPSTKKELMAKYLEFFDIDLNTTGISEELPSGQDGAWLYVYPNPAADKLTLAPTPSLLQLGEGTKEGARDNWQTATSLHQPIIKVTITDLFGRELKATQDIHVLPFQIDISDLSPGMYVLRIQYDKGNMATAKFLKISE